MKNKKILTILAVGLIFAFFEAGSFLPRFFYWLMISANLVSLYAVFNLLRDLGSKKKIIIFWLPLFLLISSAGLFYVFLSSQFAIQTVILALTITVFFFLRNLRLYSATPEKFDEQRFDNIISYLVLLAVWFGFSGLSSLQSFLDIPVWVLALISVPLVGLSVFSVFWANRISLRANYFYSGILILIFLELEWTISFLPQNFFNVGLLLTAIFYTLIGISKAYLKNQLSGKIARNYLLIGGAIICLIMLSSGWL